MNRVRQITYKPRYAQQSSFCANPQSDYHAFLCFLLEVLTGFFLPLANLKKPQENQNTTTQ